MANNLLSVDVSTTKIYKHSGFTNTILDSFSSPATSPNDLCFDGTDIYSIDTTSVKIYKHNGFSASLLNSFSGPDINAKALTIYSGNIYSTGADIGGKIFKHTGFSSSIADSFSSSGTQNLTGITHDGTNIYSTAGDTDKIYKHSGFTSAYLDSFSSPSSLPNGITWDGTNIYSCNTVLGPDRVYKHNGFSNTILDSFSGPGTSVAGLEWENYGARTGEISVTPSPSRLSVALTVYTPTVLVMPVVVSLLSLSSSARSITFPHVTIAVSRLSISSTARSASTAIRATSSYAIKIISYNPLVFISDTNPIQLTRVATTSPDNPTWEVSTITGFSNPTSVAVDATNGFLYLGCADGKIAKVDINDLSSYTTVDVTDASDFIHIGTLPSQYLLYGSTNEATGEAYIIDNRASTTISTNFQAIVSLVGVIDSNFSIIEGITISADFKVLAQAETLISTNLVVLNGSFTSLIPLGRTDWHLYLDDVEVRADDVDLLSIVISHTIGEESRATFNLARRHDKLNYNFNGDTSIITSQNGVKIYIGTNLEFSGKVAEINAVYDKSTESVEITAYATQPTEQYNNVLLPLPGLTENRHLYHVIAQNPKVYNPYIDPASTNPKKYLGVRVTLGKKISESVYKAKAFTDTRALAEDIVNGEFRPKQNYTYFWMVKAKKIAIPVVSSAISLRQQFETALATKIPFYDEPGGDNVTISTFINHQQTLFKLFQQSVQAEFQSAYITSAQLGFLNTLDSTQLAFLQYVGTTLGGLTSDLWQLQNATWWQQREYNPTEYKLGEGTITIAELEEVFPTKGTAIFNAVMGGGYINSGGTISEKFKTCQSSRDFIISYGQATSDRVYSMLESNLGYTVGSAPYKQVSCRNGVYLPVERWIDDSDGLYAEKFDAYNYLEYAKKIADLEYKKITNINGDILPISSVGLSLTLDAYYFYGLKLLTRVNLDNTTEASIYNGNNGFPVSIKSITLSSGEMKVTLDADNQKSSTELAEIDGEFPDEDSTDYFQRGYKNLIFTKYDLQTRSVVQ